jgi:hypothetical protein
MSDHLSDKPKSYEIGYGKPPEHSRFKAGKSGNPKGKRKSQKSYKSIVREAMNEKVTVHTARGSKKMTKLEALIHTSLNNGLKGDAKSVELFLKIARDTGLADDLAEGLATGMEHLKEEDEAILERVLRRERRNKTLGDERSDVPGEDI